MGVRRKFRKQNLRGTGVQNPVLWKQLDIFFPAHYLMPEKSLFQHQYKKTKMK